ncbi:hypothetical protein [Pontixanthobacter sp.]|uniref:hypothetical protein n=1 Tax=Pontixanthobacter sp. TaxID=2792078 RepID=UPI003C7C83C2
MKRLCRRAGLGAPRRPVAAAPPDRRYRITESAEEIQMRKVGAYLFGYLGLKKGLYD